MTRVQTIRDVAPSIGTLMLAWFLAMAVLVYGGEGRGDGLPSRASDPCETLRGFAMVRRPRRAMASPTRIRSASGSRESCCRRGPRPRRRSPDPGREAMSPRDAEDDCSRDGVDPTHESSNPTKYPAGR